MLNSHFLHSYCVKGSEVGKLLTVMKNIIIRKMNHHLIDRIIVLSEISTLKFYFSMKKIDKCRIKSNI